MMVSRLFLILIAVISLGACRAAKEDPFTEGGQNQEKPGNTEQAQKSNALASRIYVEIKSITPIAMTDELLTLRVAYTYNQGAVRARQVSIPIKKGEAKGQDYTSWLGTNNGTQMEALIYRSRVQYDSGDMFGFSFQVKKPFDGVGEKEAQVMIKAFISEAGSRPSLNIQKTKFEFPAKTEMRVWLNE